MNQFERPLLRGSADEKLIQVEKILRHLNRLRGNYVIGVTPPIPVFDWIQQPDDHGVVFRKLLPGNGKITMGCMFIEKLDRQVGAQAVLLVEGVLGGTKLNIPLDRQMITLQPDMPVEFGQRLTLSIEPPESCQGIWTAFLYEVAVQHAQERQQLLNGFMALVEKADEEFYDA